MFCEVLCIKQVNLIYTMYYLKTSLNTLHNYAKFINLSCLKNVYTLLLDCNNNIQIFSSAPPFTPCHS